MAEKHSTHFKRTLLIASLYLAASVNHAFAADGNSMPNASPAGLTKALELAYEKFSLVITAEGSHKGDPRLLAFLSRMENYEISITEQADVFTIRFIPLSYPGGSIRGGARNT